MNKKLLVFGLLSLLLVSSVSAYYIISPDDNDAVKDFKSKVNYLALKNEVENNGMSEDALRIKIKYFVIEPNR